MGAKRQNRTVIAIVAATLIVTAFFVASGVTRLAAQAFLPLEDAPAPAITTTAARSTREQKDDTAILQRNIFYGVPIDQAPTDEQPETTEDEVVEEVIIDGQEPLCTGNLRLVAAVEHPFGEEWSVAAITAGGNTRVYRVGQSADGNELRHIDAQQVTLAANGRACRLVMFSDEEGPAAAPRVQRTAPAEEAPLRTQLSRNQGAITDAAMEAGITRVSENNYNVERSLVDTVLQNQQELLRAARIIPHEENGQVVGVKMYGIRRNNLLGRLGIQNGDMLRTINGYDMSSPDSALEAYTRLQSSDHLTLSVVRRGQAMTLDYNIQ